MYFTYIPVHIRASVLKKKLSFNITLLIRDTSGFVLIKWRCPVSKSAEICHRNLDAVELFFRTYFLSFLWKSLKICTKTTKPVILFYENFMRWKRKNIKNLLLKKTLERIKIFYCKVNWLLYITPGNRCICRSTFLKFIFLLKRFHGFLYPLDSYDCIFCLSSFINLRNMCYIRWCTVNQVCPELISIMSIPEWIYC